MPASLVFVTAQHSNQNNLLQAASYWLVACLPRYLQSLINHYCLHNSKITNIPAFKAAISMLQNEMLPQ